MKHLNIILLAAGSSSRCGAQLPCPKQFLDLQGELSQFNLIDRSLQLFLECFSACHITLLLPEQHPLSDDWFTAWHSHLAQKNITLAICEGGKNRGESVFIGLGASSNFSTLQQPETRQQKETWALVHDVARPYLTATELKKFYNSVTTSGLAGGIVAKPVTDTLKSFDTTVATLSRENIWYSQTPQMFKQNLLYQAYEQVMKQNVQVTDEAQAMELQGHNYLLHKVNCKNDKITYIEDFQSNDSVQAHRDYL